MRRNTTHAQSHDSPCFSCLGAAWMAVIGSEMSDDWFGITDFVSYSNLIEPNTQNAELYNKGYRTFRQTYQALVEV